MYNSQEDAQIFAELLMSTELHNNELSIGKFSLRGKKGVTHIIQYNQEDWQLLKDFHDYTFSLLEGDIQLSIQLYENIRNHYRLFCYSKFNDIDGMLFSINLTTEKEVNGSIFLTQKIKFSDRHEGSGILAKQYRRMKQIVFVSMLRKLGYDVTDNNDIILGIFDTKKKQFLNTTSELFLKDFLVISLIKGHFMGNKGYELEIMPSYKIMNDFYRSYDQEINDQSLPDRVKVQNGSRNIPLSLRFKVLERDNGRCKLCGKNPMDGVKLHVDHVVPYSLGGLTVLENLQTLCMDCNLGKGNRSTRKY